MTSEKLEQIAIATKRLARTILVALEVADRPITRGTLGRAFSRLSWSPTRGEISDAIDLLEHTGKIRVATQTYRDFSNTILTLVR